MTRGCGTSFRFVRDSLLVAVASIVLVGMAPARKSTTQGAASPLSPPLEAPPDHPPAGPCAACCGGPLGIPNVYLHTGELHLSVEDLRIRGRGLDFVWARKYRSRRGPFTEQGNGWDYSYNIRIERSEEGPLPQFVVLHDGNTRVDRYRLQPGGFYAAVQFFREGRFGDDGTFTLEFADTGTWSFHPFDGRPEEGKISSISDRNGNILSFAYDTRGRLSVITDTLGRDITVSYRTDGLIQSITDFTGRQVVYGYYRDGEEGGSSGDLKSVRSPTVTGTPNDNDFPAGKMTVYTYSKGFTDTRRNHNLLTITDPKGQQWLTNVYAETADPHDPDFDRLVRQVRGDPGDFIDIVYVTSHPTQPNLRLLGVQAIVNDRVGNVCELVFDSRGRCLAKRELTGRADPDRPTTLTENRPANPVRAGDPPRFVTRYAYNEDSRVTRILHPNGNITRRVHELELDPNATWRARGNLREVHRLPGRHLPVGDQPSLHEYFEYHTDLGGCCGTNFVSRHTDARGNVTEHDYDPSGNRIQTRHRIPTIVEDFEYNQHGQLTRHVWPDNGSGWRQEDVYEYYPPGSHQTGYLRSEIVDANNLKLATTWVYDSVGNTVQLTDARGNTTSMVVNELDQVLRQSTPVTMDNGSQVQYETTFWFDANDNAVRSDVKNFDDQGSPVGANPYFTTTFDYEILNRPIRKIQELHPTRDVVTEYEYDANRNRTLTRFGEATNGSQPTNVVRMLYDERDLLFQKVRAAGDASQSTVQHDYDGNQQPVRVARGLEDVPRVTQTTFDAYGRAVERLDPMGNVTACSFDPNGNLVRLVMLGELCDVPGGTNNVPLFDVSYQYDAMDRMVATSVAHFDPITQTPIGDGTSLTLTSWTDRSERATWTDDNANVTVYTYDTANRLQTVVDAAGSSSQLSYDANHNLVRIMETEQSDLGKPAELFTTSMSYDELNRRVSTSDPLGSVQRIGYDSRDDLTFSIDALGNVTRMGYDGLARPVSSTRTMTDDGTGGGKVVGQIVRSWEWDDSSRLIRLTDDNGNTTQYGYDALNRRATIGFADETVETCHYDVHDKVVLKVDANGNQVVSRYDLLDRLSSRSIVPGPGVSSDTTSETWCFDGLSRLVEARDDDSVVQCTWDSLSNKTEEKQNGKTFSWLNDGMGNELRLTYPGGKVVRGTYDALNRVKTITNAGPVAAFDYIGPRRLERRTTAGGLATSDWSYDGARRVLEIDHRDAGSTVLDQRTFEWDAMYNKTQVKDVRTGGPGWTHAYSYDSQYRLVDTQVMDAKGSSVRSTRYGLDGVGNRTTVVGDGCAGDYVLDPTTPQPADYQMNQYTTTPCIGCIEYDLNGNEIRRGDTETIVRDYRDQIVEYKGSEVSLTYAYDALGRRISKAHSDDASTHYYYIGWEVAEERDAKDRVVAEYVWRRESAQAARNSSPGSPRGSSLPPPPQPGWRASELLEMTVSGRTFYFFGDDLGSTRVVTDDSGTVVERYEYEDFGRPTLFDAAGKRLPASAIGNDYLFTGQRFEPETAYYYYKTRYLDPTTGRFLSRDRLGIWGDAINLGNGLAYAANNPATYVDPAGLAVTCSGMQFPIAAGQIDCGSFNFVPSLCRAYKSAWTAWTHAKWWTSLELNGYPTSGWGAALAGALRGRFTTWFGGPDNDIGIVSAFRIEDVLEVVATSFVFPGVRLECESDCDNANAYVAWYDDSIHLCPNWFNGFMTPGRAAILLHEMSHQFAGLPDDYFYYPIANNAASMPNLFSTGMLIDNADTYEGFYLQFYTSTSF